MSKSHRLRVTKNQPATLAFFQRKEAANESFSAEELSQASGYPLRKSLMAKISRQEFGEFLVEQEDGRYYAQGTIGLTPKEYARRVSSEHRKTLREVAKVAPRTTTLCQRLVEKSIQAAISAIEVYNKPDFKYREETFAILMVNAWEVLLKAKIVAENGDRLESVFQLQKDATGKLVPKGSRSGNPCTISIGEAIAKVPLDPVLKDHLLALVELRDNAIHFTNENPMVKVKVQEVGTATLRNYLESTKDWFGTDLTRYNFYLMPMSFFHPHELQSYSISSEPEQHQNLLRYISSMEEAHATEEEPRYSISLELRTEFVKSKLRWAPDDPNTISIRVDAEESFQKKYIWSYKDHLLPALAKRYTDFKVDKRFNEIRKKLEADENYSKERPLDWNKPKPVKRFYSPNILKEFDKHYSKK